MNFCLKLFLSASTFFIRYTHDNHKVLLTSTKSIHVSSLQNLHALNISTTNNYNDEIQ
jgi:hypothetical protein